MYRRYCKCLHWDLYFLKMIPHLNGPDFLVQFFKHFELFNFVFQILNFLAQIFQLNRDLGNFAFRVWLKLECNLTLFLHRNNTKYVNILTTTRPYLIAKTYPQQIQHSRSRYRKWNTVQGTKWWHNTRPVQYY